MNEKLDITLHINGRDYAIRVEPRKTLVDAIRDECGQTGTHIGCEHETVLRACRALIAVTGDTNELLGFKRVTGSLQALVSEFEKNGWGSS
jgi:aerobic-type carbon monoxide dehydrogenase small subunit (CoxS/CutS family)